MYFGMIVPAYGYAYFAPGIIQGYGYGAIQTQLHSVNHFEDMRSSRVLCCLGTTIRRGLCILALDRMGF